VIAFQKVRSNPESDESWIGAVPRFRAFRKVGSQLDLGLEVTATRSNFSPDLDFRKSSQKRVPWCKYWESLASERYCSGGFQNPRHISRKFLNNCRITFSNDLLWMGKMFTAQAARERSLRITMRRGLDTVYLKLRSLALYPGACGSVNKIRLWTLTLTASSLNCWKKTAPRSRPTARIICKNMSSTASIVRNQPHSSRQVKIGQASGVPCYGR